MAKRINPRRIKIHRPYEIADAARRLGVHKNTIRNWARTGELPIFTDRRPHIVRGADLRAYLEKRQAHAKTKCPPNHFYCFRCRAPRTPEGMIANFTPRAHGAGNLGARCACCGAIMHQRCNEQRHPERFPNVKITAGNAAKSSIDHKD